MACLNTLLAVRGGPISSVTERGGWYNRARRDLRLPYLPRRASPVSPRLGVKSYEIGGSKYEIDAQDLTRNVACDGDTYSYISII